VLPLHDLLVVSGIIVVYPGFIACYYAPHKQIPVQLHELQIFTWFFASAAFIFWSNIWGPHRAQVFVIGKSSHKIILTSAYAHTVGYQLHADLTILHTNTAFSIA